MIRLRIERFDVIHSQNPVNGLAYYECGVLVGSVVLEEIVRKTTISELGEVEEMLWEPVEVVDESL